MLKIRFSRTGKKAQPSFRIVVQEHTASAKTGKVVEIVGHYQQAAQPKKAVINAERVKYWISVGAQPSDSVAALLKREGMDGMDKYLAPRNKKRKSKNAKEEAPAA